MSRASTGGKAGRMEIGAALARSSSSRERGTAPREVTTRGGSSSRGGDASRSSRSSAPKSGGSTGLRDLPPRTKGLLGALAAAAILGGVYYGWGMVFDGAGGPALVDTTEASLNDEMTRLRSMDVAELKKERKRRADALEAVMRQPTPPPEQLAEAREAARRATVALHEKEPGSDR
ncbi:MAG: hypothetical protein ACKVU4_03780 [Phycisphaerales bacterium]